MQVNLSVKAEVGKSLAVSWSPLESKYVQEYVIQRQWAGLSFANESDWVRASREDNGTLFEGNFRNCTPYEVSLFAIEGNDSISSKIASAVAFTHQCVPQRVPSFDVQLVSHDSASFSWTHTPLKDTRGHILQYQLQLDDQVFKLRAESSEFKVQGQLKPDHTYDVNLRAVSEAGLGDSYHMQFTTSSTPGSLTWLAFIGVIGFIFICTISALTCMGKIPFFEYGNVPDPKQSLLFKEIWKPHWFAPVSEPSPKNCPLEILGRASPSSLHNVSPHLYEQSLDDFYSDTRDLLCHRDLQEPFCQDGESLVGVENKGSQGLDQEWLHIPVTRSRQDNEEEQESSKGNGRGERGEDNDSKRLSEYKDSCIREEEEEEWSADLNKDEEMAHEEEDEWDFYNEPDSGYERHMPVMVQ